MQQAEQIVFCVQVGGGGGGPGCFQFQCVETRALLHKVHLAEGALPQRPQYCILSDIHNECFFDSPFLHSLYPSIAPFSHKEMISFFFHPR